MTKKSKTFRILSITFAFAILTLLSGSLFETSAQTRDPFRKPGWATPKDERARGTAGTGERTGSAEPGIPGIPSIEQRIDYYKRLREEAALAGRPIPKVTSVLALNEMSVSGIFRTPRGYAAVVEATPIKLSYTIYPGERFFDGQLVAVEENRLVFRKVTQVAKGKFVTSVENKPLRTYTQREQIQGTAPVGAETASAAQRPASDPGNASAPVAIVSPLDEMNRQATADENEKPAKSAARPVRVAGRKN
jgi:hypothetical protein